MPTGLPQGVTQSGQKSYVQGRSEYYTQNKLNTDVNFKHTHFNLRSFYALTGFLTNNKWANMNIS